MRRHQKASANLLLLLLQYVRANRLGEVFDAPFDVVLTERDVVQPDILYIAGDRRGILRDRGVFGPPDLVVEILSPASAIRDLRQKLALYQRSGVREYWIVDLESRVVDIWTSGTSALDTRRAIGAGGKIEGTVLPGFSLGLDEVFAGVDEIPLG